MVSSIIIQDEMRYKYVLLRQQHSKVTIHMNDLS